MKWLVHVSLVLVLLAVAVIGGYAAIQYARQADADLDVGPVVALPSTPAAPAAPAPPPRAATLPASVVPPIAVAKATDPATRPVTPAAAAAGASSAVQSGEQSPALAELAALRERLKALEEENATFRSTSRPAAAETAAGDDAAVTASASASSSSSSMATASTNPTTNPAGAQPTVAMIPLIGVVGVEIQAKLLDDALRDARARKTDHVVIYINSGGGLVSAVDPLMQVLARHRDLKPVAYVERALSAAALVAMGCPEIYISDGGTIGAAVAFEAYSDGDRRDVDAKFRAAWLAQCRAAAIQGGHSPLLGQAMADTQIELSRVDGPGGAPLVKLSSEAGGVAPFKVRGAPLVLTGPEAVDCGLARKVCSLDELAAARGLSDWTVVNEEGWRQTLADMKSVRKSAEVSVISREVAQLESALTEVRARMRALNDLKRRVLDEQQAAITALNADYATKRTTASPSAAPPGTPARPGDRAREREREREQARIERNAKAAEIAALRARFATATKEVDAAAANLSIQQRRIEARRDELRGEIEARQSPPPSPTTTTATTMPTTRQSG